MATGTLFTLLAIAFELSTRSSLIVGFGLALSSTAFGMQALSDKGQLGTPYGRTSFAILLLQDLAIVPLMALLPLLALNSFLSELRESMDSGLLPAFQLECHLVKGNHREEIIKVATGIGADLVVVGDLPHSRLTRLIIDSTADAVTRQMKCSVLVVKSPEFVTPIVVDEN